MIDKILLSFLKYPPKFKDRMDGMKFFTDFRIILILCLFLSFRTGGAEELSLSSSLKPLYTLKDTVSLEWTLSSERPSEEFKVSDIEPPFSKDLELIASEMHAGKSMQDSKNVYHFYFQFRPLKLGQVEIKSPEVVVKDSSDKTNSYKAKSLKISVVTVFRRYRFLLFALLLALACGFPIIFLIKMKKKKELKQIQAMKAGQFETLKAEAETRFSALLKTSSAYLIAGEYASYCRNIFQAFTEYLQSVYPELPAVKEETALSLLKPYIPDFSHKKLAQYLYLTEEILYTGKTPMASDLDRLLILAKELVAEHRAHACRGNNTGNQNNFSSF